MPLLGAGLRRDWSMVLVEIVEELFVVDRGPDRDLGSFVILVLALIALSVFQLGLEAGAPLVSFAGTQRRLDLRLALRAMFAIERLTLPLRPEAIEEPLGTLERAPGDVTLSDPQHDFTEAQREMRIGPR